jgi:hypothetical protein
VLLLRRLCENSCSAFTGRHDLIQNRCNFKTWCEDGKDIFFARLCLAVDKLERLLQAEPGAHELISPYIAVVIGDLSIVSQCLGQLKLYQSETRNIDNAFMDWEDDIKRSLRSGVNHGS